MAEKELVSRHILIDGDLAERLEKFADAEHRPTLSNAANAALRRFFAAVDKAGAHGSRKPARTPR